MMSGMRPRVLTVLLTALLMAGGVTLAPQSGERNHERLAAFDADIAAGKYGYVDSMLVMFDGRVMFERQYRHDYGRIYAEHARRPGALNAHDPSGPYNYFNPWWHPFYRRGDLHTMQSVTKTVTSVVIGTAIARKEFPGLDTPVLKFFPVDGVRNTDDRKRRMTIRHLLTMTDGLEWNENLPYNDPNNTTSAMEASADWVEFTVHRPMAREPGTAFNYNSGATQLLAHIFRAASGTDIEEYAHRHLFAPLGIGDYFWKRTPTGLVDSEGGLYLRARDLATIGQLFLQHGEWNNTRIVDAQWVSSSTAAAVSTARDGASYGFKWWLYPYGSQGRLAWSGGGFGGQILIVLPEERTVAVFTGWNILPGGPRLTHRVAIDRVLEAIRRR
jgi:CubicO group peptidase (beta-lactamase class C family)